MKAVVQRDNKADSVQSQLIRNFQEDNEFAFDADETESQERDTDIRSARKIILTVQFWMRLSENTVEVAGVRERSW